MDVSYASLHPGRLRRGSFNRRRSGPELSAIPKPPKISSRRRAKSDDSQFLSPFSMDPNGTVASSPPSSPYSTYHKRSVSPQQETTLIYHIASPPSAGPKDQCTERPSHTDPGPTKKMKNAASDFARISPQLYSLFPPPHRLHEQTIAKPREEASCSSSWLNGSSEQILERTVPPADMLSGSWKPSCAPRTQGDRVIRPRCAPQILHTRLKALSMTLNISTIHREDIPTWI